MKTSTYELVSLAGVEPEARWYPGPRDVQPSPSTSNLIFEASEINKYLIRNNCYTYVIAKTEYWH